MSTPSSASNNRTEFIFQRNNGSGNSWEVSEAPSCENLVVNLEFPDQSSMNCHRKRLNSHNSSSTQEDDSHPAFHHQLCEFHQRIVHHRSPTRAHHASKCSTKSDRRYNQDHVVNSTPQPEEPAPISCRASSYPERITGSKDQNHVAKCSASNREGVEIKRNTTRTPRSVYNKQPINIHLEDVRGDTNEGCCKHCSPNVQNPHFCLTPTSTDSGPDVYEQKPSKQFCEPSTSPPSNEAAAQLLSSSYKKQKSFEQDVSQDYSRTKAKEHCFDPYTTTDFFTKPCDCATVQTLQEILLNRNLRSSVAANQVDPYKLQFLIDADKPCSSCLRRRSSRKDSLQNALKEALFLKNPGENMMRHCSCNKPNISKCMSAREMPSNCSRKQCCPLKCASLPPLNVPSTCKATKSMCSREKMQVPTRDCVTSDCVKDNLPKASTCSIQQAKRSFMSDSDNPMHFKGISKSQLKLGDIVEKLQKENPKQNFSSTMAFAKKSCEQIAMKLLNAERPKFPGPRCLLGVSFDDAIIDFLSCFKVPVKPCKPSKCKDSQVKLKLITWLNEQYEALGRDLVEAKSRPACSQGSLSPTSLAERKKILDSLCRLIGIKTGCTCTCLEEQLRKKMDDTPCKRCTGSKLGEYLGADLEGTSEVTINKTDANPNYTDCFPYSKCDESSEKISLCEPSISPENTCSFTCSTNKSSPDFFKADQSQVQLSLDLKQTVRLRNSSQCSRETERSSGSQYGIPLVGPGANSESRTFNDIQFPKSTARSSSSNVSTTSESSQNYKNALMQQKLLRYSNLLSRGRDSLSRITERSSEMRSTDEDFRKPNRLVKSSVSFKEDLPCRDSEQEINGPETRLKQETDMSGCQQTTPRSILRQCRPEQTNEAYASPDMSSYINESSALAPILASRQHNISSSPECVCGAVKMLVENMKQPVQTSTKPALKVCVCKSSYGTERNNNDKGNILQREAEASRSKGELPCMGGQCNEHKMRSCPIHLTQINSSPLQFRNSFQKSDCPCPKKQLPSCHCQTLSNRELRKSFRDVLMKAKSEYFQTKCLGQCTPIQPFLSKPKVLSSIEVQNSKQCPVKPSQCTAKPSQCQIPSSPVASLESKCEQKPSKLSYGKCSRPLTAESNANLSSPEKAGNNTSICNEDRLSQSTGLSPSPCPCEVGNNSKQEIGFTVKLKKPFEEARISYSRIIQPKTREPQQETCNSKQCPARPKEEQHKQSLKPNPSNSILRSCRSICQSLNKSFTGDHERCGMSELKTSEANTSNKWLLDQGYEPAHFSTQEQPPIIESPNSTPCVTADSSYKDIIEDFPDDQDGKQPHESFYINSKEELSLCEGCNLKAKDALPSTVSFKSTGVGTEDNTGTSFRSYGTEEPITQCICLSPNSNPSEGSAILENISIREKTRNENVNGTVQMTAENQNLGAENNESATSNSVNSSPRSCLQKCSTIGKKKTKMNKMQIFKESGMPNTCPCGFLKCGIADYYTDESRECCCELHHKDDNMYICIDLCRNGRRKENVGLNITRNVKTCSEKTTRPHSEGTGGPSCSESRPKEANNLGTACGESNRQRRVYRALSTQTGNESENPKRSVPKKIKWAVAKISVFDDSSKTYELMEVEPVLRTPNSDSVVIVVPENRD